MGIFKKSENQINDLPNIFETFSFPFGYEIRRHSDIYLWTILQTIFEGLKNVRYYSNDNEDYFRNIINFLDANQQTIIWQYWNLGFICLGYVNGQMYIPKKEDIVRDANGKVLNFDVVFYSEKYMYERKTAMQMINESLHAIDVYKSGEIHITETFGSVGILTGKGLPTNPIEKENLEKEIKESVGIKKDKKQLILTTMPLEFKQMTFPISQLSLSEKIENELKTLCRFFNLPVDMVIGNTTYENQKQSVVNFYRNCISPIAEVVLSVGRYVVKKDFKNFIPSEKLTFRIDNVSELEDDRTSEIEYKLKLVDLVEKMRNLDIDTKEYEDQLKKVL